MVKILVTLFALFAASRAYLQYRNKAISPLALTAWFLVWAIIVFFTWWPAFTDLIANTVGVGRGVDALVYFSIIVLFYGVFRIYIKLEFIEREITSLVRRIALDKVNEKEKKYERTDH